MSTKVGLVMAYKGSNYGAQLQAYATQHVIESFGFETSIIDYKLISIIKDTCFVEPIPLEKVLTGNRALYESIPERKERQMFVTTYREKGLHEACSIKEIKYPIIKAYYSKKFRATFRNLLKALQLK